MFKNHNHLRDTNLSTNQDYNMIDGGAEQRLDPATPAPGKGAGQGEGAHNKYRSREREER